MNRPDDRTKMTRRRWLATAAAMLTLGGNLAAAKEAPSPAAGRPPLIGIASVNDGNYVKAVRAAGGIPVVLPDGDASPATIDAYLDRLDGLLMPGGLDIPPSEYGEDPHPTVEVLSDARYEFERALGRAWIERGDKPLLGICLGSQWMNVLLGGSLIQDIPSEVGADHRGPDHPVTLEADSKLAEILGTTELKVNSSHHQAVDKLAPGLRIVGKSPDGVIEAIEGLDPERFLIGVQWHPERMIELDPGQMKLFRAFVEAAATVSAE